MLGFAFLCGRRRIVWQTITGGSVCPITFRLRLHCRRNMRAANWLRHSRPIRPAPPPPCWREPRIALRPDMDVSAAMRLQMSRHYPVYPVCDAEGRLLGLVRGQAIFEAKAFEITAQAGSMVGVEKEERISTPMMRSFKFRHPWLQLNLLTAFLAGGVVAMFHGTIDKLVILAAFLPVLAGQSGNTGCQALAG